MSAIEVHRVLDAVRKADASGLVERLDRRHGGVLIALPSAHAKDAVGSFLEEWSVSGLEVYTHPDTQLPQRGGLGPARWALSFPIRHAAQVKRLFLDDDWFATPAATDKKRVWWVFPKYCVRTHHSLEKHLRLALDCVTPDALDEQGVPLPWVPAEAPTAALGGGRSLDDDIERVSEASPLAPLPPFSDAPLNPDSDDSIRDSLRRLCARAGFGDVPLQIVRVPESRDGFVAGRVWLTSLGPCRIQLEVGPNADAAEVWATLVHEVAHGLAPKDGHGPVFKRELLRLAEAIFGVEFFRVPAAQVSEAHAALDWWVAVGIRASIHGGSPPTEASGDEEQLAKVVDRIQKLRRLARSQLGRPEGRSACAKANDLLVRWDLGAYSVRLAEGIHDQMCDRWVDVGKRSVWRRQLAFIVAEYCGVFSLSRKSKGWMHFFGRYVDVVTAQWFYEIWEAHIIRTADAHIRSFKKRPATARSKKSSRSERVDFCDSAVLALSLKLRDLEATHDAVAEEGESIAVRRVKAEAFAGDQFELRGRRWSSGTGKRVTVNAAGIAAGRNAPMGRGVGGPTGTKGLLSS